MCVTEADDVGAVSRVAQWYAGRSVLVTGGTGYLGKAIVEKLLRSCPDIVTIYLLVRPKRGLDPQQRINAYASEVVFSKLREERPDFARHLSVVAGDLSAPDFRLAEQDLADLKRDVSVVFHCAASVRFDDSLRKAVTINVLGTKRLLELAQQMPNLQVFTYVSTTYCHSDHPVLEEKLYAAEADPEKIMDLVSEMDDDTLSALTPKLLGNLPNTYVLSKNLTEQLVANYASKLPIVISRPSIVVPAWREPAPGWVDNINGPLGMFIAGSKGLLLCVVCDGDTAGDIIPVDCAANAIIAIAWHFAETRPPSPYVCNVASADKFRISWGEMMDEYRHLSRNVIPVEPGIWYPLGNITKSVIKRNLIHFFFELLPAYLLDFLIVLSGRKPFLVHVQNRIQTGILMLEYYMVQEWLFVNKRMCSLLDVMSPHDRDTFYFDMSKLDRKKYLYDAMIGTKVYILHEDLSRIPTILKQIRRMYWLHVAAKAALYASLLWLLYSWSRTLLGTAAVVVGGPRFASLFREA